MTNLLIPAALTSTLRIPDLTMSTGEPGGVWCTRSWGGLRGSRRHVIRLPYEPAAAAKLRKLAVLDRVDQAILPLYLLYFAMLVWLRPASGTLWPAAFSPIVFVSMALRERWKVDPTPSRTSRGDLYLPDLPPAVAHRWLEANPGVRAVDRTPTYRRWPPAVYAVGSALCAAGAVTTLGWTLRGGDIPLFVLFGLLALVAGALTLAYLALPTGHSRLNGNGPIP